MWGVLFGGVLFWGHFGLYLNFWKCFMNDNVWLWGGLFSEIYSLESPVYDFWIFSMFSRFFFRVIFGFLKFSKRFWNKNVWLWGIYLVRFIHLRAPYLIFGYLIYLGVLLGLFLSFEIFWKCFWMIICDFGEVYLVKFVHWRAPYMIFGYLVFLAGSFLG